MQHGKKIYTLFSSTNKKWHHDLRKCINGAFTPGAAASYEYLVQYTIQAFMKRIEENHANKPHTIDLFTWFYYFSFDVIGDLTYSERHGFIEEEKDVHGIIVFIQDALSYGYFVRHAFPLLPLSSTFDGQLLVLARALTLPLPVLLSGVKCQL